MTDITTFPIPTALLDPAEYPEFVGAKGDQGDQGLPGDQGPQGPAGTIENGMTVVNHGATADTARPTGAAAVYWIGTVEPTNAVDGDLWFGDVA
jgi:hypothetical protein